MPQAAFGRSRAVTLMPRLARARFWKTRDLKYLCGTLTWLLLAGISVRAQASEARLSVVSLAPPRIKIEGAQSDPTNVWSFRNVYAGMLGLGERIEHLSLSDAQGSDVPVRRLAPGEYESARAATRFSYEVKLDPPVIAVNAAHVSWLTEERGALLLGDLLPLRLPHAKLRLSLPARWHAVTLEAKSADGRYDSEDPASATFFIGPNLREHQGRARALDFTLAVAGDWAFADEDVVEIVTAILKEHEETIGVVPRRRALVVLAPFPHQADALQWSAETRAGTTLLLSGRWATKTAGLAQLGVPLAHELFHLWVPNGLRLSGAYDWFYEGFTQYQAMRAAMRLGYLAFQDYLNALARAYDNYLAVQDGEQLSLLEASRRRFSGATAHVYNKGVVIAYLYDLEVRRRTGGKRSLDDVYREVFRRDKASDHARDGNAAVIDALNAIAKSEALTERYIKNAGAIDLASALAPFGLRVERFGARIRVAVADSLSGEQRDLLRRIGYNEKAAPTSKTLRQRFRLRLGG